MELSAVGERVFAAEALLKRRIRKVGAPTPAAAAAPPSPRRPAAPLQAAPPSPRPPPAERRCSGGSGGSGCGWGRPFLLPSACTGCAGRACRAAACRALCAGLPAAGCGLRGCCTRIFFLSSFFVAFPPPAPPSAPILPPTPVPLPPPRVFFDTRVGCRRVLVARVRLHV